MARVYHRDSNGRFASGGGGGGGGGRKPKTAAGRASANLRAAQKARSANPFDKKAANKAITAQAAKEYYRDFGGGRKGAAKPKRTGKSVGKGPAKQKGPSAAERKQAMVRKVSKAVLDRQPVSRSARRYVEKQQDEKMRTQRNPGKGSKAARRAASRKR